MIWSQIVGVCVFYFLSHFSDLGREGQPKNYPRTTAKPETENNLRRSRPRYGWRWGEAWPSATVCTRARSSTWGISSSSSGTLGGPNVVLAVSWTLSWTSNLWPRIASRWRFCSNVRHAILPSDPRLRHGRIPVICLRRRVSKAEFSSTGWKALLW